MTNLPWVLTTTEWDVTYPVQPLDPIGMIRREHGGFHAWCSEEYLGVHDTGDHAAEAIWARFLEQNRTRHQEASHTHGAYERHRAHKDV